MESWAGPIAATTLALLWSAESIAPGLAPKASARQRVRHIVIGVVNGGVGLLAAGLLLLADTVARKSGIGLLHLFEWPWWMCFMVALILLDLWQYACHVLYHAVPVLWRFHAVHHTADHMEATVAMRFHAIEIGMQGLLTIPFAVVLGISTVEVAAYHLLLLPASMFHHSSLRLSPPLDRMLRLFIVTPRMHWLHHSRWQPETNSNYSAVLSIWDRLFGTLRTRLRPETVEFGLDGFDRVDTKSLRGMIVQPFEGARSEYGRAPRPDLLRPDGGVFTNDHDDRA